MSFGQGVEGSMVARGLFVPVRRNTETLLGKRTCGNEGGGERYIYGGGDEHIQRELELQVGKRRSKRGSRQKKRGEWRWKGTYVEVEGNEDE